MKQKLLIIVGPTASGKSDLAVRLAQDFNGEVISADSRQVYTGLDIGTGKITPEEMKGVPHHLLNVADPSKPFTVVEWRALAEKAIADISSRGKLPIICGGTGFYISTLIDDISLPDVPANQILRNELASKSTEELFALLKESDSVRAQGMNISDRKNPRRLIRAIEIAQHNGSIATDTGTLKPNTQRESSYDALWIGIAPPLVELKKKIADRLEKRLNQGMIGEVDTLHQKGLSWERMDELGLEYRFVSHHLQGMLDAENMKEKLAIEIGQYAKRQMTWFRRNKNIQWFETVDMEKISKLAKDFLNVN